MALGMIKLDRIAHENFRAIYKVSTDHYESRDFYVEVDSNKCFIKFYLDKDLSTVVYMVDESNKDEPIKRIPGVHHRALFGALAKAFTMMESILFPEKLSYGG